MSKSIPVALAVSAAPTASVTGPGVDLSNYTGNGHLVLNAAIPAAGQTLDLKLQHSRDNGATDAWSDAGVAFSQVTNSNGLQYQYQVLGIDGLKQYVRHVSTIAGSAAALPYSVEYYGKVAR